MKIEKLKAKARRHEQREEWAKAKEFYAQALEEAGEQDEGDIAIHNRIGDLQVRLGNLDGAVESYERAIDLYLEADLANNALAVCRKLERNAPGRASVLLKMGHIRVRQGFVVDAREDFLNYAERQLARGDSDEALRALEEFAALAPADVEIRLFLADHLRKAERAGDAAEYLRQAYRTLMEQGDLERADDLKARALELDPEMDPDRAPAQAKGSPLAPEDEATGDEPLGFETTALADMALDDAPTEVTADAPATEGGVLEQGPDDEGAEEEPPLKQDDPLSGTVFSFDDPLDEADIEAEEPVEDLPTLEPRDAEEPVADLSFQDFSLDEMTGDQEEDLAMDLPLLEDPSGVDDDDEEEPLPADLPPVEEPSGRDTGPLPPGPVDGAGPELIAELKRRIERDPDDATTWRKLGGAFFEMGKEEHGREALERAHRAFGRAGDPEKAMRVLRELIFHDPDHIEYYQRLVEYAHMTDDRALLVPAFLELAEALARTGAQGKAEAVYGQVLALDPRNPRARAAFIPAAQEEPAGSGFVNLGGMVLDEPRVESFRWKVADAEPSGDEEADFARMLSQFKEKVAQNVPSDDATAHYDLGAAYRDMGLLDEAVAQFQQAIRAEPTLLAAYEMVGQCFLDKDAPDIAVRTLTRALDLRTPVEEELLGIYYYLGKAHEAVGNSESAREFYERVFSLDINFQDVTERLRSLR